MKTTDPKNTTTRRRGRKKPTYTMPEVQPCEPGGNCTLHDLQQYHIKLVIDRTETIAEAAGILGIDLATLYRKRRRASQSC